MFKGIINTVVVFLILLITDNTFAVEPETYRNVELGFEISYLPNWYRAQGPGDSPFFIKRRSDTEAATISVDVARFTGNKEEVMNGFRANTDWYLSKIQRRFPDAEILERSDTYLGGYPAYLIIASYTIKNLDLEFVVVATQVLCIKSDRFYVVNFETLSQTFEKTFNEFRAILASFNFR